MHGRLSDEDVEAAVEFTIRPSVLGRRRLFRELVELPLIALASEFSYITAHSRRLNGQRVTASRKAADIFGETTKV